MEGELGRSRLNDVRGLYKTGNTLYVLEASAIYTIDLSKTTFPMTLFAGHPMQTGSTDGVGTSARFNGLSGITSDGTYLYVTDSSNHTIRKINPSTKEVTLFAGKVGVTTPAPVVTPTPSPVPIADAVFSSPFGIIYDSNRSAFFVSENIAGGYIKKVSSDSVVAIAGGGSFTVVTDACQDKDNVATSSSRARLDRPRGMAIWNNNFLFFAEATSNQVNVLDLTADADKTKLKRVIGVCNVAGNTTGNGEQTALSDPTGLALDGNSLYISNGAGTTILKANLAAFDYDNAKTSVTTEIFTGTFGMRDNKDGDSNTSRLTNSHSLVTDGTYLYHSEFLGRVVRRTHLTSKVTETLAGTTQSLVDALNLKQGLFAARSLLYNSPTELIIGDYNNVFRKFNPTTGKASLWLGTPGEQSSAFPGNAIGSLVDDGRNYYFYASRSNHVIMKIHKSTGNVSLLAGGYQQPGSTNSADPTLARFAIPQSPVMVGNNLYVHDYHNNKLRKIALTYDGANEITGAEVSDWATGLTSNSGFYMVTDGTSIYLPDYAPQRRYIWRFSTTVSNTKTVIAGASPSPLPLEDGLDKTLDLDAAGTAARFSAPHGLAYESTTNSLYMTDSGTCKIRQIELTSGSFNVTTPYGPPNGITSCSLVDAYGNQARFAAPRHITAGGGALWVSEDELLRKVDLSTQLVTTVYGGWRSSASTGVSGYSVGDATFERHPTYRAITQIGTDFYVTDADSQVIRKVNSAGQSSVYAGKQDTPGDQKSDLTQSRFLRPLGIASDGSRYLYVSEFSGNIISKIDTQSETVSVLAGSVNQRGTTDATGSSARFYQPTWMTYYNGFLYVVDSGNYTIRKIDVGNGDTTTLIGTAGTLGTADGTGTLATISAVAGLVAHENYLYYSELSGSKLKRISLGATAEVTTLVGASGTSGFTDGSSTDALLFSPRGIATDGKVIYIADYAGRSLRTYNLTNGTVKTLISGEWLAADIDDPSTTINNRLFGVESIYLDSSGTLYLTTGTNIRKLYAP